MGRQEEHNWTLWDFPLRWRRHCMSRCPLQSLGSRSTALTRCFLDGLPSFWLDAWWGAFGNALPIPEDMLAMTEKKLVCHNAMKAHTFLYTQNTCTTPTTHNIHTQIFLSGLDCQSLPHHIGALGFFLAMLLLEVAFVYPEAAEPSCVSLCRDGCASKCECLEALRLLSLHVYVCLVAVVPQSCNAWRLRGSWAFIHMCA